MNSIFIKHIKTILTKIILPIILFAPLKQILAQQGRDQQVKEFNLVFSEVSFTHVNEIDAKASINIYIKKYKTGWEEESGQILEPKIITLSKSNSIKDILASGIPSIFQISSIEYIENEDILKSRPYVVGTTGNDVLEIFELLVRKESNIRSLLDLNNKNLVCIGGISGQIAKMWLDTEVLEKAHQKSENYFKKIELVENPSKAMLSLFFKNSDACIINKASFEVLCEMNPQMKKEIISIDQSEGFLPGMSVLVNSSDKTFNDYINRFALNLPREEHSKQMLLLFRIDDIIPFEDKFLDNNRNLVHRNKSLTKKYIGSK